MKRTSLIVLLVMAFVLVFGFAAVAGAATFSDIEGNTAADDIVKLNALDIINGYPDGTFQPDGSITRAEFAKIAVVSAGLKDSADLLKNTPSQFSDVKVGEWYTGWINLAASQSFVKGDPDGTFRPNDNISYAEVITVLMRVLGYNDNLPGDWPVDYIVKAATLGVTKNVAIIAGDAATRGNVASLTSNTLDKETVDWTNDKEKFEVVKDNNGNAVTLLDDKFSGSVTKDKVVRDWQYNSTKDAFQIRVLNVTDANDDGVLDTAADSAWITVDKAAKISGANDATGLVNKMVDYLLNKDGDIVWAAVKGYGSVSTQQKDGGNFALVDGNGTVIKVYKTNYNLADGAASNALALLAANDAFAAGQEFAALLNKDGNVAYVYTKDPGLPGIFKSYSSATKKATLATAGDQGGVTIDLSKTNGKFRITRDGAAVAITDLQAGDLVTFNAPSKGYDVVVTASSKSVEGTLDAADGGLTKVTVAGTSYNLGGNGGAVPQLSTNDGKTYANLAAVVALKDVFGEQVIVALDSLGKVAYIKSSVAKTVDLYGVVDDIASTTGLGGTTVTSVTVLTPDGSKATYNVDKSGDWYAAGVYKVAKGNLIQYALKDTGKIGAPTVILTDANQDGTGANSTIIGYDDKLGRLQLTATDVPGNSGYYYVTDATVIFDPFGGSGNDKNEVVSVDSFKEALKDFAFGTIQVHYKVKDNVVQYIAAAQNIAWGAGGSNLAVVLGTSYDGKYRITVNNKATQVTYEVEAAAAADADYTGAKKGDLIDYTLTGGKISLGADITIVEAKTAAEDGIIVEANAVTQSIKVEDGNNVSTWYSFDKDTVVYDVSGSDPAYTDFDGLGAGLDVSILDGGNGILDWVVIK